MITYEKLQDKVSKYKNDSALIQETDTKVLVWDTEFVFEANKLGEFWYVRIEK